MNLVAGLELALRQRNQPLRIRESAREPRIADTLGIRERLPGVRVRLAFQEFSAHLDVLLVRQHTDTELCSALAGSVFLSDPLSKDLALGERLIDGGGESLL